MNESKQTTMTKNRFQTAIELRSCGVCDFQSEMPIGTRLCPKCDEPNLQTAESVALQGAITAILGAILMFMGFGLILIAGESFENAGKVKPKLGLAATRPPPNAEFIVFSILGGLFCLGLSFFIVGAVQAYHRRRNITLLNWSVSLTNFFFFFAYLLMYLFSE